MVRGLTVSDVSEIYELRRMLEPVLIRRTFDQVTEDDLARCEELIATMEKTSDIALWSKLNGRFHALLSGPDGDMRTVRLVESLRDASMPYVALSLYGREDELARSNDDHKRIVRAYRQRDLALVTELNDLHLQATIEIIRQKLSAPEG
jgi:DNA-binding GntR family transcriptional regulator